VAADTSFSSISGCSFLIQAITKIIV